MGDKVINWILEHMSGLTQWVGSLGEAQLILLGLAAMTAFVLFYNYIRLKVNGLFSDKEHYEDWMDAELWEAGA